MKGYDNAKRLALCAVVDSITAAFASGAAVSEVWDAVASGAAQARQGRMAQTAQDAADAAGEVYK
jgi:hypothetical protein